MTRSTKRSGASEQAGQGQARGATAPEELIARVHVDLPRVRPQDMVTTQDVTSPHDPMGGRDTETEFMLRNAGW